MNFLKITSLQTNSMFMCIHLYQLLEIQIKIESLLHCVDIYDNDCNLQI